MESSIGLQFNINATSQVAHTQYVPAVYLSWVQTALGTARENAVNSPPFSPAMAAWTRLTDCLSSAATLLEAMIQQGQSAPNPQQDKDFNRIHNKIDALMKEYDNIPGFAAACRTDMSILSDIVYPH